MTRPRIAVTTSGRSGWRIFPLVAFNVWLVGGRAVRWGTGRDADLGTVDGVIIGGGDDISPDLYGGALVQSARLDPARDALEQETIRQAIARNMPVLGICRGSQMLNVASGGSLDQDAYATFTRSTRVYTILPRKSVKVCDGTGLADIAGRSAMKVNALHSQAVDRLGRGLRVAARDDGGMIQGIERTSDPFALGVQWHPEHLFYARRQRAIFRALVTAARAFARDRGQVGAVDAALRTEPDPAGRVFQVPAGRRVGRLCRRQTASPGRQIHLARGGRLISTAFASWPVARPNLVPRS